MRSFASRSMRLLESLEARELVHDDSWTAHAVESLSSLRRLTTSTPLREVPEAPIETYHLQATQNARHPAYRVALRWYEPVVALDRAANPAQLSSPVPQCVRPPREGPRRRS